MDLPTAITGTDVNVNVPGALPSLWDHQMAALQRMHNFESMVQRPFEHMPHTTPRGVLALPPGAGKSRVVLALCLSEPRVKTLIVVVPNMLSHWERELAAVNIHEGDSYVELITNKQASARIDNSIDGHRIIYDETESLRNAVGRAATTFAHEQDNGRIHARPYTMWLLDGTYTIDNHVKQCRVQHWSLKDGPSAMKTIYTPYVSIVKSKAFGIDYFPLNIILSDHDYVIRSQDLKLLAPKIIDVQMRNAVRHLSFLQAGDFIHFNEFGLTNVEEYCRAARTKLETQLHECNDCLHRFDDDLLTDQMTAMSLFDSAHADHTSPTPVPTAKASTTLNFLQAKQKQKDEIKRKLTLLEKLMNNTEKCAICWNATIEPPVAVTKCCYTRFCYDCIEPWLSEEMSCPMCRKHTDVSQLLVDDKASLHVTCRQKLHPITLMSHYGVIPARNEGKKVLVYVDAGKTKDDIIACDEHIEHCIRLLGRDICVSAKLYPSALKDFNDHDVQNKGGRVVFITDQNGGVKGLDLSATDIIIVMGHLDDAKMAQLIGRAQRPGRRSDNQLHIIRASSATN